MDSTSPLSSDSDGPADEISAAPAPVSRPPRPERLLRRKLAADEELLGWGRAWLSRDGKLHGLLAARTLDFVVVTEDDLLVFSTGFFSRRPRRRVYELPLDRLDGKERTASRRRRLAVWTKGRRGLLIEMRRNPRNDAVADRILRRVARNEGQMTVQLRPPAEEE
jgi:hypothetical protein